MSDRSASESEGDLGHSSPHHSEEEDEEWHRFQSSNWEYTLSGDLRAIRPEGPFHLPVTVFLARRNPQTSNWELDSSCKVFPGDTIVNVEHRLGLHRSGISAGNLCCPVSREDLISRGEDPDLPGRNDGDRVFMQPTLRVEELHGYF